MSAASLHPNDQAPTSSGRKILVIQGHPHSQSLCGALAGAYIDGAKGGDHEVRSLEVGALRFDPVLHVGFNSAQGLEPDLVRAQADLAWANHLVVVYPVWWGGPPALLKGFIDRTFLPGFAFQYRPSSPLPQKLLVGKSARLIVTADSPGWWLALSGNPAVRLVKGPVLRFCGVTPVRTTTMSAVRSSSLQRREAWVAAARRLGEQAA